MIHKSFTSHYKSKFSHETSSTDKVLYGSIEMIVMMPKELSPAGSMDKSSSIATLCQDRELEEQTPKFRRVRKHRTSLSTYSTLSTELVLRVLPKVIFL